MYCYNCGKQINAEFKHCPYCGTDLNELSSNKTNSQEQSEAIPETPDVEIMIADRKLYFRPDFMEYNALRKRFFDKAAKLESEYIEYYSYKEHSFDSLFDEEIPNVVYKTIDAVKFGVSVLMEYGIDDIDDEQLAALVSQDENIKDHLEYIYERAFEIEQYAERLADYRNVEKASRSHWEGGGFGVGGAIKGALTAGAFNIGTNIFRGIGDSITNASDKGMISKMKNELANDKEVFKCLHNTVFEYSLRVFYSIENILIEEDIIPEFEFDYRRAESRANNYIKQYNEKNSDKAVYKKTIDVICESINISPYSVSLYLSLYNLYKGPKDEIHNLAKQFGIERDYKIALIKSDSNWVETVKSWEDSTIDELDKKIAELEHVQTDNIYIQINQDITNLKKKKEELNKQEADSKKILFYKNQSTNAIISYDIEKLWELAEAKNAYAEHLLMSHYMELCVKKPNGDYTEKQKEKIMTDVMQKAKKENDLAKFMVRYIIYNETNTKELYALAKDIEKNNVFVSPLYYAGYYALKRRNGAKLSDFYESDAIRCINKSANMLFPPALKYASELYKYGKYGIVNSNKELSERYEKLSKVYDYPILPSLIDNEEFVNNKIMEIKELRNNIDSAIKNNDYNNVAQQIKKGNVYAEYIFERNFLKVHKFNIGDNVSEYVKKEVKDKNFTDYLATHILYELYSSLAKNNDDSSIKQKMQNYADEIINISKKGNISAIYTVGRWKMNTENVAVTHNEWKWKDSSLRIAQEGVRLLEVAANHLHPLALYTLGYSYYKGSYPLAEDEKLAKYYLTLAAAYDLQDAKDILTKMENQQKSAETSGCFITSAVCKSFGKEDDCYELKMFRDFRDNWLSKQVDGEHLVNEYYKIAPIIVKTIDAMANNKEIYKDIWNTYLKKCLSFIENNLYEDCKKKYCEMVDNLKELYIKKELLAYDYLSR